MAFEAFLEAGNQRPRRRRRLIYAVSLAVHGALLSGGVAYSFWHVEEITPPTVRVTFLTSAPPLSGPPPPPAGGGSTEAPRTKTPPRKVRASLTTLLEPRLDPPKKEDSKPEPDDDDPAQTFAGGAKGSASAIGNNGSEEGRPGGKEGGKQGGKEGGQANGTLGGSLTKSAGPKMLAPQIGALQKESGDDPDFPALLRRSGMFYVVLSKICVSKTGSVDSVSILKGANSLLDDNVRSAVKKWHYRPLVADNNAVPFCYFGRFEFKSN